MKILNLQEIENEFDTTKYYKNTTINIKQYLFSNHLKNKIGIHKYKEHNIDKNRVYISVLKNRYILTMPYNSEFCLVAENEDDNEYIINIYENIIIYMSKLSYKICVEKPLEDEIHIFDFNKRANCKQAKGKSFKLKNKSYDLFITSKGNLCKKSFIGHKKIKTMGINKRVNNFNTHKINSIKEFLELFI